MITETPIGYCYCCGRPRPTDIYDWNHAIVVPFIDGGTLICRQCDTYMKRVRIPCYSLAALNPRLRKYEQAVASGKIDIGLRVHVSFDDGTEYSQPMKMPAERVAY